MTLFEKLCITAIVICLAFLIFGLGSILMTKTFDRIPARIIIIMVCVLTVVVLVGVVMFALSVTWRL